METAQIDFYKGIFIKDILAKMPGFNFKVLGLQSDDVDVTVDNIPLADFYAKLKTLSEEFATAMGAQ